MRFYSIHPKAISEWMPKLLLKIMSLKIIFLKPLPHLTGANELTHWSRVSHICISKITIIGSDNGLSPGRRQAIIWTSVGILLIGPLGTNFSEISIEIYTFSFKKMHLKNVVWKMAAILSQPQCVKGPPYPHECFPVNDGHRGPQYWLVCVSPVTTIKCVRKCMS